MKRLDLTVVIPAYNEERRIGSTMAEVRAFFRSKGFLHEIIVVDDGSTDRTQAVAAETGDRVKDIRIMSHPRNLGKGAAVKTGVLAAQGDWVLFTDSDLSVPLTEFDALWNAAKTGADVVIASRRGPGSRIVRGQGVTRRAFGRIFSIMVKLLVLSGVSDTQCGFKLFRRAVGQRAFRQVRTGGPLFDIEFLIAVARTEGRIREVPVVWEHHPETRIPYRVSSAVAVLVDLVGIKARWRIGLPVSVSKTGQPGHAIRAL